MLKPTIQLFIKALIIGVLVNLSLQHVASTPLQADEKPALHYEQLLKQTPTDPNLHFSDQGN
jgi:hypothetical protein